MTPFELGLEKELHIEWQRFHNKWLFPWYSLNMERGLVEVEDFRGGHFHVGGIMFQGQIQTMYWHSIGRYLNREIHATFRKWDEATRNYPPELREASLEGTEQLLKVFVAKVVKSSTDTDRGLRGGGDSRSVEVYNSTGYQSGGNAEILRLVDSYKKLMPKPAHAPEADVSAPARFSLLKWIEEFYADRKGLVWVIGLVVAFGAALLKVFVG